MGSIQTNKLNLTLLIFMIGIIISLVGWVFADTKEELKQKADNKTVIIMIENMKESQKKEREDRKEKEQHQQKVNDKVLDAIQVILLDIQKQ